MPIGGRAARRDTARAMSQENVERTYRAMDAVNRRDLDTVLALADDDIVVVDAEDVGDVTVATLGFSVHGAGSDRKYAWWRSFDTRAEALEAAGLSE